MSRLARSAVPGPQPIDLTRPDPGPAEPGSVAPGAPHLPHERDQSIGNEASPPRPEMQQAKNDVDAGLVDTDRGPVADELYRRELRGPKGAAPPRSTPKPATRRRPKA